MRAWLTVVLLVLLSGCSSPPPAPPVETTVDATVEGPLQAWSQAGNTSLGWIVGLGEDTFLGDGTLGLTSHDVCPRKFFIVPRGTESLRINWTAPNLQMDRPGAGYYTLVISQPEEIHFIEPAVDEGLREWQGPPPGVWELKVQARSAAYNLVWDLGVGMSGNGPLEPPLEFFHDGDCIQ